MNTKQKVIVIGAGYGGLSVAALLAKYNYNVTILEKNDQVGGRAMMFSEQGFSFDMGPSWYLMPDIFENYFKEFGKKVENYYTLKKLEPAYRIYFDKKDYIDIPTKKEELFALFDTFEEKGGEKLKKYLQDAQYKYDVAVKEFLYKEYTKITDFFNKRLVFEGLRLDVFSKMSSYVEKYFSSKKAQKILQYTLVFLGGSPSNTPAIYSLMSHVDLNLGVWYPIGGMNAVAQGLKNLGEEHGVEYILNADVQKIEDNKTHKTVYTHTDEYDADIIICNADYHHVEMNLLEKKDRSYDKKYWDSRTVAPSGFILYLGLKEEIPELKHHTLFFENDWEKHFEEIFKKPQWPDKPSYYICAPSKTDQTVAPQGKECVFVLVPVASDLEDSDEFRQQYARKIIQHISGILGRDIEDLIEFKRIFTHKNFKQEYNAFKGTALGLSHTLFQTALFRPSMQSKKMSDLYYVGQYTHPGIGVPMTMISAQIVAEKIIKKYG